MNISKIDINKATKGAKSYDDFKFNLSEMGYKVPEDIPTKNGKRTFPSMMKGFYRKLRYEISKDPEFGSRMKGHDLRQNAYYKRLEKLGHPDPLKLMATQI